MLLALSLSVIVLSLYGIQFNLHGFNKDYLSRNITDSIKGIFILLIVISHARQYIPVDGYAYDKIGDSLFLFFYYLLDQLVVVMFLFYSGYGVCESYKKKGDGYVRSLPYHRILGTLLNFDIAVVIFIILCLVLGAWISFKQCLFALIGWGSVGNSNWYIFVILICYCLTYGILRLPIKKPFYRCAMLFCLCMGCIVFLSFYKTNCWYNTILCYPLGFMYSTYKDRIEAYLQKEYWRTSIILLVVFVPIYLLFHNCQIDRFQIGYNVVSMMFALLIIMLTIKVRINNKPLRWAGAHLFPIYIYMRVPMMVMQYKAPELLVTHFALFVVISMIATLIIAHFFKHWEIRI